MKEMISGEIPSFDEIYMSLKELEKIINRQFFKESEGLKFFALFELLSAKIRNPLNRELQENQNT